MQQQTKHYQINHSIYCKRNKPGLIDILSTDHYLMGEYSERTGTVIWQRLIAAPQRLSIERWLTENFPVPKEVAPVKTIKRETRAGSGKKAKSASV